MFVLCYQQMIVYDIMVLVELGKERVNPQSVYIWGRGEVAHKVCPYTLKSYCRRLYNNLCMCDLINEIKSRC